MTEIENAASALAKANDTLADLRKQRAAIEGEAFDLTDERGQIAYAAHTGDAQAKRRLDKLHEAIARNNSAMISLDGAIAEAERRIAAARADVERAHLRENARQARSRAAAMRAAGDEAQRALAVFVDKFAAVIEAGDEARALGLGGPNRDLLRVNVARAVQSALGEVRLATTVIPPNQRVALTDLIEGWCAQIEVRAEEIFAQPAPALRHRKHVEEKVT